MINWRLISYSPRRHDGGRAHREFREESFFLLRAQQFLLNKIFLMEFFTRTSIKKLKRFFLLLLLGKRSIKDWRNIFFNYPSKNCKLKEISRFFHFRLHFFSHFNFLIILSIVWMIDVATCSRRHHRHLFSYSFSHF